MLNEMKNNKIINTLCLTLFVAFSMFSAEVNGDDKNNQSGEKSAPGPHTKEAFMDSNDENGDGIVSKGAGLNRSSDSQRRIRMVMAN